MAHKYSGILLSHKNNAFDSVLMRQMNLEPITQSEVSHKEKNKYHINAYIRGIQKDGTDEPICRAAMETQILRTDVRTQNGKEWMGQIVAWKHICKIDSHWDFAA